ncbi:MAG: hypothetical protein JXE07_00570 [Candidatus Aminicenantes bacterium]|nr:hypothetical protein [Candidatus Aminicenantes bacterium]
MSLIFVPGYQRLTDQPVLLPDLEKPEAIVMNSAYLAVADGPSVKLFDGRTFQFIQTIGREGQGPGEFQDFANPQLLPQHILVSSTNKASLFTLDGDLVEEKKHGLGASYVLAVKDRYVAFDIIRPADQSEGFQLVYNLYDSNFRKIRELHRGEWLLKKNRRRGFFEIFFYETYEDKIVLAHRQGFVIEILDTEGDIVHTIRPEFQPLPFTDKDKEEVRRYWREERGYNREQLAFLEKRTDFPDHYPPLLAGRVDDGKIYAVTYRKEMGRHECLVYDMHGRFIKRTWLPLTLAAPNFAGPFAIRSDTLYQLIYDDKESVWKLHRDVLD